MYWPPTVHLKFPMRCPRQISMLGAGNPTTCFTVAIVFLRSVLENRNRRNQKEGRTCSGSITSVPAVLAENAVPMMKKAKEMSAAMAYQAPK